MSTSSYDSVFGVKTSLVTLLAGATLGQFVDVIDGQNGIMVQFLSGGTLYLSGTTTGTGTAGTTMGASALAAAFASAWIMPTTPVSFDGLPRFYLMATGATTVVQIMRTRSQGF